jgi:hypothetical protein
MGSALDSAAAGGRAARTGKGTGVFYQPPARRPPGSGVQTTASTKNAPRSKSKAARRAAPRPTRGEGFPFLPVAVGGALAAVLIGLFAYVAISSGRSGARPTASVQQQYGCANPEMTTQTHFHVHLAIYVGGGPGTGQPDPLQTAIGQNVTGSTGFCWLHTHTVTGNQDSIIHIEAPYSRAQQGFTLGDFLKVWKLTNPDATFAPGPGQREVVYVNGKVYKGAVTSIPLKSLEDIEIEILGPDQSPTQPPAYQWPSGFTQ